MQPKQQTGKLSTGQSERDATATATTTTTGTRC
jgi:hypothetical protein